VICGKDYAGVGRLTVTFDFSYCSASQPSSMVDSGKLLKALVSLEILIKANSLRSKRRGEGIQRTRKILTAGFGLEN